MSGPINPYQLSLEASIPPVMAYGNYADLAQTALGLRIIYDSIVLMILSLIGLFVSAFAFPPARIPLSILLMVATLVWNTGPFFCLSAPAETRTRGLIIGCIISQVSALVLIAVPLLGVQTFAFARLPNLLTFIGTTLFVFALMRFAIYIRRDDLHAAARRILLGTLFLFVLVLGTVFGVAFMGPRVAILLSVVGLGMLILFVMYANLVNSLASAMQSLRG